MFSLLSGAEIPHSHDFTNFSHYYYSRLSANQKATYKKILSGIKTYAEEITIPYSHIDETNIIFKSILRDNPLVFYVTSFTQSSVQYKRSCTFIPDYTFGYCEVKEKTDAIQGYLRVFDYVKNNSDFEKELFIHDYCLENFSYDNRFGGNAYSVLGLVFNNSAVCEGIAKFVKLAFDYLSVKSLVVTGKSNNPHQCTTWESHAWNIVRIDGKTYHLDVTFDITLTSKRHRYDYFNLTDEDIKKDHIISDTVPACITNGIDHFSLNSLVMHNTAELEHFIAKSLKQGITNVYLKLVNASFSQKLVDKVINIAMQKYVDIFNCSVSVSVDYNSGQMVFELDIK